MEQPRKIKDNIASEDVYNDSTYSRTHQHTMYGRMLSRSLLRDGHTSHHIEHSPGLLVFRNVVPITQLLHDICLNLILHILLFPRPTNQQYTEVGSSSPTSCAQRRRLDICQETARRVAADVLGTEPARFERAPPVGFLKPLQE